MRNTEVSLADVRKKMESQITRTRLKEMGFSRYEMKLTEFRTIYKLIESDDLFEVISLVFMYGASKGYRFAKNQKMKEGNTK